MAGHPILIILVAAVAIGFTLMSFALCALWVRLSRTAVL